MTCFDSAFYRAFHRFGQAKFPNGGSVLGSSQFSVLPQLFSTAPAASKNDDAWFKSGQNQLKNKQLALLI